MGIVKTDVPMTAALCCQTIDALAEAYPVCRSRCIGTTAFGREILEHFEDYLPKFKKIIPADYKRMITTIGQMEEKGMSHEKATMEAFYAVRKG